VVALHVDPPDHAVVLSIDEKSQIQALDRTQPGLPMKKGRAGTLSPPTCCPWLRLARPLRAAEHCKAASNCVQYILLVATINHG
jgi:hypothetical protein